MEIQDATWSSSAVKAEKGVDCGLCNDMTNSAEGLQEHVFSRHLQDAARVWFPAARRCKQQHINMPQRLQLSPAQA